jgi:hypothetical protein
MESSGGDFYYLRDAHGSTREREKTMNKRFKAPFFAADNPPGSPPAPEPPVTPPAPVDPAKPPEPQEKRFTQAELDAIVTDRLKRKEESEAKEREKLKLKAEQEAAEKNGEWQKLAETNEKARLAAEQERDAERERNKSIRIETAFLAEANKAQFGDDGKKKFIDSDAAYRLALKDAVAVDADRVTGVTDALKALAKEKPWMLEAAPAALGPGSPAKGKLPNSTTPPATAKPAFRTRY